MFINPFFLTAKRLNIIIMGRGKNNPVLGRNGLIFIYQVRHNFVPCPEKLCRNVSHIYMKLCRM